MSNRCCLCGISTIFFIWSSTRDFPIEKLRELIKIGKDESMPVCFNCYNSKIKNEEI